MTDIAAAASAAKALPKAPLVVVDNTLLGPVFQHPLDRGADLVVYSATKYLAGFSERHDLGAAGALSLRHLDVARDRTVIIGAQVVNGPVGAEALVFKHQRQHRPQTVVLPLEVAKGLAGYVSSIACDRAGQLVAVTSSKGACAIVLDVASGRVVHTHRIDDVSGIAPGAAPADFLTTAGTGRIALLTGEDGASAETGAAPWMWDNHAVFVADSLSRVSAVRAPRPRP
jgi:hypothetical protein